MEKYFRLKSVACVFDEKKHVLYPLKEDGLPDLEKEIIIDDILQKDLWKNISFEDKEYIISKIKKDG
jgi:hypothetical protein